MRNPHDDDAAAQARSPQLTAGLAALTELALDLRWSWNHAADAVWRDLDPVQWESTHHPCDVLQSVSRERLDRMLSDPAFRARLDALVASKTRSLSEPAWFQKQHPASSLACVAYFSMEFMLSEALPIYSGGLGNVAGDQLKTASDLGVPVVGVGLLYQQGYFRQVLDRDGAQQALYPYNDPGQLPITAVRDHTGERLRLEVVLPGYSVWIRVWRVRVGRVRLYLLDSNDMANSPAHRGITSGLYDGVPELRLKQEMLLGLGGWRLLRALGLKPDVCHLNEGHAALAVLERARDLMQDSRLPFATALAITRAGNLFTTHTAVAAGFDRFAPALIGQYLDSYASELGITLDDLLALGRAHPSDPSEPFNMAYLAIRGSGAVNGVSRLHGVVSRQLFAPLFPGWPTGEVPVGHVTNGVHMPTWDSEAADALWTDACGKERWLGTTEDLDQRIREVPDATLWKFRQAARKPFLDYVRRRLALQVTAAGASAAEIDRAQAVFDPAALTVVIARRFATYKRPTLLLHDPERLIRMLTDPKRPVQIVVAGKAHPADQAGQALIREWAQFVKNPAVRSRATFLSDYDMLMAERLVQGADLWINTPRRPWEASGTSGMKVLVNGGLNLSEMDGWWAEAYAPDVGWSLGDGQQHGDDPALDSAETAALYDRLENEVIPEFYARDADGVPVAWVRRMRESMARLTPRFSADRTVRDYVEQHYLPAAAAYQARLADQGALGRRIVDWQCHLDRTWPRLSFGGMSVATRAGQHAFSVDVDLVDMYRTDVRVELYANGVAGGDPERHAMQLTGRSGERSGSATFIATVPADRPATDYTARLIPELPGVQVPLESTHILWQR
jgi:starch phosphorylase